MRPIEACFAEDRFRVAIDQLEDFQTAPLSFRLQSTHAASIAKSWRAGKGDRGTTPKAGAALVMREAARVTERGTQGKHIRSSLP